LACQFCALVVGYFYRVYLGPHKTSPTVRHVIQILVGVPLTYFCFGRSDVYQMLFVAAGYLKAVVIEKSSDYCFRHIFTFFLQIT